ncbi:MAG: amidohydrolase [Thermoplasmata archaeon]|nr:amidohydrolase [Thermoplasmata archaeon]
MNPAEPAPTVFRDALVVSQDAQRRVHRADVRVEKGRFVHVGPSAPTEGATLVDAHGFALVPGFVNAHTHVAMGPLRGLADDRDLGGFLERLFAVDAKRTEADVEAGALAGVAEMLLSGTTSFLDLYYFEDAVARAVDALGARGFLGWAVLDPEMTTQKEKPLDNAAGFLSRWQDRPRIQALVAPQGVYVCNEATWLGAKELADRNRTLVHYHLAETRREVHEHEAKTGLRPPLWLDKIGFLGPRQVAAHGVWLTRREVETLAKRSVGVAHCPSSNLKLAVGGVAPVREMRECGVVVGLGTDSVASNNSLSMLREMHVAGLLQKHQTWDASVLPAQTLLDMATIEGTRLLGRAAELGSIEVGKRADFSLVRLDHPTMVPARPEAIVSHLAYSASDEVIDSVFVDGECVVRHRELVRRPWEPIRAGAEAAAQALWPPG